MCLKIVAECKEYVLMETVAIQDTQDRVYLFIRYLYRDETRPETRKRPKKWADRCDKSLRHVAATGCCNKSSRVTCENHCRCDRILSLRSVAQIQTGLNSCDISQRQTKHKRLVAAAVQTRRLVAATCRRDLWHRVSRPLFVVEHSLLSTCVHPLQT